MSITASKIMSRDLLKSLAKRWREEDLSIVFTNGCFDILHLGHVDYLEKASCFGDRLVIGLNSDVSIQRLKGSSRPIQDEQGRARILAALQCVSAVVVFDEDTPLNLINALKPDVLVKGADYDLEGVVGAKEVLHNGGKVELVQFVDGYSTSRIVEKIKAGE